jgi:YHS domain-containing protein
MDVTKEMDLLEVLYAMKEKDPVCLKTIDTDKETRHAKYKVRDFYFCSDQCMEVFESSPDVFYIVDL